MSRVKLTSERKFTVTSHAAGVTGLQKIGRTRMNKKVQLHKHRHVPVSRWNLRL